MASSAQWQAPYGGYYTVRVTNLAPTTGKYNLSLRQTDRYLAPLGYPPWIWPVDEPRGRQLVIRGRSAGDNLGRAIATGDVNDDGFTDLTLGVLGSQFDWPFEGEVYVLTGPFVFGQTITVLDQIALYIVSTEENSGLGTYLDSGDLNGDGIDDIVMGAYNETVSPIYVYLGSPTIGTAMPRTIMAWPDGMALTVRGADSGFIVCNVNGDGYDDLFVERAERVWGVLGSPSLSMNRPLTVDVATDPVDVVITGFRPLSWWWPSRENLGCGDVDGDGFDDLIVGAFGESPTGEFEVAGAGRVYIIRGSPHITAGQPTTLAQRGGE